MNVVFRFVVPVALAMAVVAAPAQAFFVDGQGHYGLLGFTETAPAFSRNTGTFQGIQQSFKLLGEARASDQLSMFVDLRLFDNPRAAYLGDDTQAENCGSAGSAACDADAHQNTSEPSYKPYNITASRAFVRYAFDYCIVEAGRRSREWGLGIFLDAGDDPFETSASLFDGVTCNVNIQKSQTLGFSIGYDKLAETGTYVDTSERGGGRRFGAYDQGDDVDQYFFTIQYDDRKANAGAAFTKQIGVYFAQVTSRGLDKGGANTDLKFLDLYTGFYLSDFALRNEVLFRMGKSADPNFQQLGGSQFKDGEPATNKVDAIALAGSLEWTIARAGAPIGPAEYNRGDTRRHVAFVDYAYAPGSKQGYFNDNHAGAADTDKVKLDQRDADVTAVAFHRNYKPALILFNAGPQADERSVDGAFDASRVVNATVFAAGYRYESLETGNFEAKLITARLNTDVPADVKAFYSQRPDAQRPAGFYGRELGYELDLGYSYVIGREVELGAAIGAALPGDAWKVSETTKPANNFVIQTSAAWKF